MSKDYTTIRVETAARDEAADAKGDEETWSEYLRRCGDNPPEVVEYVAASELEQGGEVTLEASEYRKIAEEVAGELR